MRVASKVALLLALLVLFWAGIMKGGLCRSDPDPRPADTCKPGDKECNVDEPAEPSEPPIGKAP
jgi:hypothetical protein